MSNKFDPPISAKKKPLRFFSLKWKALILFSLVLFAINASFTIFGYLNMRNHFDRQREVENRHYSHEIDALFEESSKRLQQLAEMIPLLTGMHTPLVENNTKEIIRVFENHWPLIQLNMGIDRVHFYNDSSQLIAKWETKISEKISIIQKQEVIRQVNKTEFPLNGLHCSIECIQYSIVPMVADGQNIGVILLESSVTDLILNFKKITAADIGIITIQDDNAANESISDKFLTGWGADVIAITDVEKNIAILEKTASENNTINKLFGGVQTTIKDQRYEISLFPIKDFFNVGKSYWIIINDITATTNHIQEATRQSLYVGILGLFISEIILLGILWLPMLRLRRISQTIPLLAQDAFKDVRVVLHKTRRSSDWTNDEIDILDETTINLSHELEGLKNQVADRTKVISLRMDELSYERDFVTSLLDTAQVLITTHNKKGKIIMLNQHGRLITGYSTSDLHKKSFYDLFPSKALKKNVYKSVKTLFAGSRDHFSHECGMVCDDGTRRDVAWFHSSLPGRGVSGEPTILSIGLDITKRKKAETEVSWMADHDPLTGLFNRRRFQDELEKILSHSKRYNHSGALLFFDLDQFKYVNDTSGHHAGDALLKVVADKLSGLIRTSDVIGRMGGDEFAMVVPQTDEKNALHVARKISESLSSIELPVRGHNHKVSASIGISIFPVHGIRVYDLFANADFAMYQAKEAGRGRWHLFSRKEQARECVDNYLVHWKKKIEYALDKDAFILHYQPIMNINNKVVSHYEVLLRMREEDGKIATPASFINVAEKTGLIQSIDHMVLNKAVNYLADLADNNIDITLSINLSGHALKNRELLPYLKKMIQSKGIDPSKLIFEITETVAVTDLSAARSLMYDIKSLGCSFALDDFGSGFSSYNYLKQLPVNYIKISGSFIRELSDNPDNQIFVKALREVAKGLGKKTIAGCVEDLETFELLKEYGINFAQGYHIGRPSSVVL